MAKKCYIVAVGSPTFTADYDWEYHVFLDGNAAEIFFNQEIKDQIEMTIDNNDLTEDEADEYRNTVIENSTENYAYDDEGEWAVKLEEADFEG